MNKALILFYGVFAYCLFLSVFIYAEEFLLDIFVPRSINSHVNPDKFSAVTINLILIIVFGLFHSIMSRAWFKNRWTKVIPQAAERSTYVLQASLLLALVMWYWQALPGVLWQFEGAAAWPFYICFTLGNIVALWSTFLIDHLELFGLKQVWRNQKNERLSEAIFKTPSLYKIVRHPMHLGVLMVFWSTPTLTEGHLLFASAMTAYVFIGIVFEERSLRNEFREQYARYQKRVPMLIPGLVWSR